MYHPLSEAFAAAASVEEVVAAAAAFAEAVFDCPALAQVDGFAGFPDFEDAAVVRPVHRFLLHFFAELEAAVVAARVVADAVRRGFETEVADYFLIAHLSCHYPFHRVTHFCVDCFSPGCASLYVQPRQQTPVQLL